MPSLFYVSGCVFHSVHTAVVKLLAQNKKKIEALKCVGCGLCQHNSHPMCIVRRSKRSSGLFWHKSASDVGGKE